MRHGSLFSGMGGFDLAAQWMGWENVFHCEWNEFGQKILKHYWPEAETFGDITKSDFTKYANTIDILSGGFPCQPYSTAGKRKGKEDERHLWPFMLRAIREISPRWVVGENVRGLTNWNGGLVFDEVQADLEAEGYEVLPFLLPACAVDAPHRRDRIWFIAHAGNNVLAGGLDNGRNRQQAAGSEGENQQPGRWNENGQRVRAEPGTSSAVATYTEGEGIGRILRDMENEDGKQQAQKESGQGKSTAGDISRIGNVTNTSSERFQRRQSDGAFDPETQERREQPPRSVSQFRQADNWQHFPTQPPLCSGNDGLSTRVDLTAISFPKWRNESIKAAGNAVVPQVVYEIFKAIEKYELLDSDQNPDECDATEA